MATMETPRTEVRAEARYVRTAPRKAQLVAEQIRGRTVPEARTILAFTSRDAARDMEKVLNSAVANAEANHGLAGDDLVVSAAYVGAGPTIKRWRARARGRVARIRKRTCHITIRLAAPDGASAPTAPREATPEPPAKAAKPRRGRVAKTTEPVEQAEDKPKTRPKRAQKPKADDTKAEATEKTPRRTRSRKTAEGDEAAEKPKRTPRRKKTEGEEKT